MIDEPCGSTNWAGFQFLVLCGVFVLKVSNIAVFGLAIGLVFH